jgi:hypothetical protein
MWYCQVSIPCLLNFHTPQSLPGPSSAPCRVQLALRTTSPKFFPCPWIPAHWAMYSKVSTRRTFLPVYLSCCASSPPPSFVSPYFLGQSPSFLMSRFMLRAASRLQAQPSPNPKTNEAEERQSSKRKSNLDYPPGSDACSMPPFVPILSRTPSPFPCGPPSSTHGSFSGQWRHTETKPLRQFRSPVQVS